MFGFRDRRRVRPPLPEPSGHVTADADPELIRDAHLFLLDRIGRNMGLAFHPQPSLEPPTDERIVVLGRFDTRARQREFGLELGVEEARHVRVAWLIDLYIPESRRNQGFGTRLMRDLVNLWAEAGVSEARLTATADGLGAYECWGFVADDSRDRLDVGLHPMRLKLA
ncbi:MAG TPA: GNAT family N-acetyltransferase [Solirubrobacterales bacterium]|jgi:GNAT superfamily N-acetyltransferase|nr:GNAT family N-acetyltransferase [Solirubrobacterales bacterium]